MIIGSRIIDNLITPEERKEILRINKEIENEQELNLMKYPNYNSIFTHLYRVAIHAVSEKDRSTVRDLLAELFPPNYLKEMEKHGYKL